MRAEVKNIPKRMVIAHLGGGCSVTALFDGCSVDTNMGLTPTGGVVMETRPGDLDPGLILYLIRQQNTANEKATSAVETMLNHASGMVALAGMAGDVKAIRNAAAAGSKYPPAEPEALRLLAPQRGLIATGEKQKQQRESRSAMSFARTKATAGGFTPGILKVLLPPRLSRGFSRSE